MQQLQIDPGASDSGSALKSIRLAKCFWSLLILLAILVHLAAFVMVEFVGVLDAKEAEKAKTAKKAKIAKTKPATTRAAAKPAEPKEAEDEAAPMNVVKTVMGEAMPIAKLVAPLAAAVLAVALFLAVVVAVADRAGGSAGFVSAFLWSVVLLAMLTPWQHIFQDLQIYGALYDGGLAEIKSAKNAIVTTEMADKVLYYARFIAYPVIALLVWVLVQCKFGSGCKAAGSPFRVRRTTGSPAACRGARCTCLAPPATMPRPPSREILAASTVASC